jgi:hypothetical protein
VVADICASRRGDETWPWYPGESGRVNTQADGNAPCRSLNMAADAAPVPARRRPPGIPLPSPSRPRGGSFLAAGRLSSDRLNTTIKQSPATAPGSGCLREVCAPARPARGAVLAQPPSKSAFHNKLLAALPSDALARLLPKLHAVNLPLRKTLCVPQERIEAIYFIESGWVSMVAHLDEGTQAEVGLVGFEGMIGLPLVVGVETASTDTYMQASGTAARGTDGPWPCAGKVVLGADDFSGVLAERYGYVIER